MRPADYLLTNLSWKVLSLVLATSIWLTIHFSVQGNLKPPRNPMAAVSTLTLHLPITVKSAATEERAFKVTPSAVAVTLGGDTKILDKVKESEIEVFIDLKDVVEARNLRKKVQVNPPAGTTLVKVVPTEVSVEPLPTAESQNDQRKERP